jgi:hypothetical protein
MNLTRRKFLKAVAIALLSAPIMVDLRMPKARDIIPTREQADQMFADALYEMKMANLSDRAESIKIPVHHHWIDRYGVSGIKQYAKKHGITLSSRS